MIFLRISLIIFIAGLLASCQDHESPTDPVQFPDALEERIFYALTDDNLLYELDVTRPLASSRVLRLVAWSPDEKIIAIDFRPATGQLYALGRSGAYYSVNLDLNTNGKPTVVNLKTEVEADFSANAYGFDFNPVTDRPRLVTDKGENLSLDPYSGALDNRSNGVRGVATPNVHAIAYSNNYSGAMETTLYGIDPIADQLVRYKGVDAREVETIGGLGADIAEVGGFDISPRTSRSPEYGIASVRRGDRWEIDYVHLGSGKLQRIGDAPPGNIIGIAVPTHVAYAVSKNGKLLAFNPIDRLERDPEKLISTKIITGLAPGDSILGMDFSVNHSCFYALASDSKIYRIDPATGHAVFSRELPVKLNLEATGTFGFDIEPFGARAHVVTGIYQRFYASPQYSDFQSLNAFIYNGKMQGLDGLAFTNNQTSLPRQNATTLYGIDSQTCNLFKLDTVYNELNLVARLDLAFDKFNGFDIGGMAELGYGVFKVGGRTRIYEIELEQGIIARELSTLPYDIRAFALGRYIYNNVP
ncbi:hypothetical protein GCM10010967_31870 [Dyadobacter beijingensis]|uniref:DUF4394 domain-containing protein n=1 Tax=Dyadobacter beijingensis TaxID=365489 RepID=A0ABQ2I088_9BACT|nr:DUF4394 domain-containing protein [Dyadobacter beijingensis]GGM95981.1 hypothetical protein GCM10010967_31870 [Dyadobacter beijingensis]